MNYWIGIKRVFLVCILPLLPLMAFVCWTPISHQWRAWKREWKA